MPDLVPLDWPTITDAADRLAERWEPCGYLAAVAPVPRGGCVPAALVAGLLDLPVIDLDSIGADIDRDAVLVVDDLVDSGTTGARYADGPFDVLFRKPASPTDLAPHAVELDGWLVFPWEAGTEDTGPTDAVVRLLSHIGEDPTRDGLIDTPARVVKAYTEMTQGYRLDPAVVLGTTFDVGNCDELVIVSGVAFTSLCEHHLLPFTGTATVGYLPGARVVGLSKLARLVDLYAQRLQVQERMTTQVATAIMEHLDAQAAGVVIRASHQCMSCRGVRKVAEMTTSAMFGRLRDDPAMRAEFLGLAR